MFDYNRFVGVSGMGDAKQLCAGATNKSTGSRPLATLVGPAMRVQGYGRYTKRSPGCKHVK